ncbi:MAG: AMP-binding protein [Phycisphaerales bacterium]|nr:AMP-binding protein [Phycisphaerales bacterium]
MNLGTALAWTLLKDANREFVSDDRRSYKGVELLIGAMHIADQVDAICSVPRVGLLIPTSGAFPIAALGAWLSGRAMVPMNYLLQQDELQYIIDDCGCDVIIASRQLVEHIGFVPKVKHIIYLEDLKFRSMPSPRLPKLTPPQSLAVLLYTSGTSGRPKGVMLSHANLLANARQVTSHIQIRSSDIFFGVLPQFHSFGLTALTLVPLMAQARVVYAARFMPKKIVESIRKNRPTVFLGIPSMYNALLTVKSATKEDFQSLRIALSGGEPLPDDVSRRFHERFGIKISEGYGMTETSPVTNVFLPGEIPVGSVGRALPGVIERVVDPATGDILPPDTDGELRIAGPNVMSGYFNLETETKEAFDEHGFLRTGDIARIDPDGFLFITGRIKEMMIVGGENVFPREIEEVLDAHPSVHASGVTGLHDPMRGEVPVAFVEIEEECSVDSDALKVWCRERLAGYKVPKRIEIVQELPRNATGKIVRRRLLPLLDSTS